MSYEFRVRRPIEETILFEKIRASETHNYKWVGGMRDFLKNNAFKAIFTFGLLIGLPVSPSILKGTHKDISLCAKLWCFALSTIKTLMIIVTMAYLHQILPTTSLRLTFYVYEFCGYSSLILVFRKRKKLFTATLNLCHLSKVLCPSSYIGGKHIKLYIAFFICAIALLNACLFIFFFQQEFTHYYQLIYIPSIIKDYSKSSYLNFTLLSIIASFTMSVTTCGFIFLLSCNLYEELGKLIHGYEQSLKVRTRKISWSMTVISDDITTFKNITFRVQEVDDAVKLCVFFLYGVMMSGFFNTISVVITEDPSFKTTIIQCYVAWIFTAAAGTFMILSHYGSNIIDSGDKIKRRMVEYSDKFIRSTPPLETLEAFGFLFDIIMQSNMVVTGGGMFVINNGLILTIAGTMITYGVLILQLSSSK